MLDADTASAEGCAKSHWGFPQSALLLVQNGFDEPLPGDEAQRVVVDFFKGE